MSELRLRPGVHYAPIDGGVYFSSAQAIFVVKGPRSLFPVVDTCVPVLEDGSDLDRLVAVVGTEAARALIERLLAAFDSRGLLLHLDRLATPEPPPEERDRFPETLAYLEAQCDDPYSAFDRLRDAHVLVIGPAETLAPAVRGLVRAGARRVTVACDRPERLARLAARHPEIDLLPDPAAAPPSGASPDLAIVVSQGDVPAELVSATPATWLTIPVHLGKDLAIVGPVVAPETVSSATTLHAVERLWARAADWQTLDGSELLVKPSGDLLATALAGQAALDALAGLNPRRVHLVHGPDLASDTIALGLATGTECEPSADAVLSLRKGAPVDASLTGWLEPLSARWVGLFRLAVPGELPQMPLALTLAEGRSQGFQGRVVGFGPNHETASHEAGLAALRHHCAGLAQAGGNDGHAGPAIDGPAIDGPAIDRPATRSVAAAGSDPAGWVLDGALRLAARRLLANPQESEVAWFDLTDVAARRMWRTLEDHEQIPVSVTGRQAAGLGWHLVSVYRRDSRTPLASGWGPSVAVGARVALSGALATAQVRRTVDAGYAGPGRDAGYVAHAHDPFRDQLVEGVGALLAMPGLGTASIEPAGRRLRGQRLAADAVAGPIGAWCGWVWTDD